MAEAIATDTPSRLISVSRRRRSLGVAGTALILALVLGFALSWSLVRPIQDIDERRQNEDLCRAHTHPTLTDSGNTVNRCGIHLPILFIDNVEDAQVEPRPPSPNLRHPHKPSLVR